MCIRDRFNVFSYFFGNRTAGLPCAVTITCLFYGAISGSGPATTAAVGSMCIPLLTSVGYDLTFEMCIRDSILASMPVPPVTTALPPMVSAPSIGQ